MVERRSEGPCEPRHYDGEKRGRTGSRDLGWPALGGGIDPLWLLLLMGGISLSFPLLALTGARQPAGDGIRMQLPWK